MSRLLRQRVQPLVAAALTLAALSISSMTPAHAGTGNTTVTMTVQQGTLSVSPPASLAAGTFTVGATAAFTASNIIVADARGSEAGWTLSMTANDFSDGSSHYITYTNITVNPVTPTIDDPTSQPVSGLTTHSQSTLGGTDTTPGTTQSSSGGTLIVAPSNQGAGSYYESPQFSVKIPFTTYSTGSTVPYTSTYVFTVA